MWLHAPLLCWTWPEKYSMSEKVFDGVHDALQQGTLPAKCLA